ncbi:MAG: hypothetical protein GWO00_00495 [Gemmatimonadetes bacterium]|nr:hypothetical protein [Gemmatimonadota bacterium]NIR76915.1 hypothetical protein [Gemmatimonadota bacterium]NIT85444.1 hypothetical protein [Gemmatimonadota bacterium]NIU33426.1 hypothetical protein [Gemmatimonadota bacterium]NIV59675.1 hypothetical protein [Gemmatimonadota bacterium]
MTGELSAAGAPDRLWVSRVFASHHEPGTAYVTKTGYRRDDFRPHVYRTADYGRSWTEIGQDLPDRPVNVVFEDPDAPDLLYVGNDLGVYVSVDGGGGWARVKANMPDVAVHDLLVHPRENDLVAATYGRGAWVTDVTALKELTPEVLAADLHLFAVEPKPHRDREAWGNYELYGDRHVTTPNEPTGLVLTYYLREGQGEEVELGVADTEGRRIRTLAAPGTAGIHRVVWDMEDGEGEMMGPGTYGVTLGAAGGSVSRAARIEPSDPVGAAPRSPGARPSGRLGTGNR